jgi:adenylate cyclase
MDRFLNHRYRLDTEIGQGAMGTVYRGHDVLLDRDVAVKVLRKTVLDDQDRTRLLHEARAAARLNHPNIVAVHDAGQAGDVPFIVMEMVEGRSLHDGPPQGLADVLACALQICAGLEHAHSHGIIHRDLKPENVMILADGTVKIMDFGLARFAAAQHAPDGAITGTPFYLAPEQALGQPVDARTDLYALGVMLYELVTGELPFEGDDVLAVVAKHLYTPVVAPSAHYPGLPPDLDALVVQLLNKNQADRPASAAETARRLQQVLAREFPSTTPDMLTTRIPPFLSQVPPPAGKRPPVVARDAELARLDRFLERMLGGDGRVVVIRGEAGAGKTVLATEFARRAGEGYPNLLVATGNCNASTGIGDAYLPFREVLAVLTGDLEAKWAAGLISSEAARRLWAALPLALQALARYGQALVDVLVPGQSLVSRLETAGLSDEEWMDGVRTFVSERAGHPAQLEQALIFEQVTRVLTALANQRPLLLFLDDLQWGDAASIALLYHLSRRLQGSRILIVAAYRPDEVALGRDGGPHPLAKVLSELKRYSGDMVIDLEQAQESAGRSFVDALVDTEPNQLGPKFREALYNLTGGHPLFTVELLRAMEDRGELTQDQAGTYVATPLLDWSRLPARVEGVVEERIGRLGDDLQQILSVASVEGEAFTAQVVARVLGGDEREVIRHLGRELAGTHHLAIAQDAVHVEGKRLQRYRFRHNLFQWHLYHALPPAERELLHEQVADALESLYGPAAGEIAPQLAYHYSQAGTADRAVTYLELAGEQARARYAVEEAIAYYDRALDQIPESDLATRFRLLLARQEGLDLRGDRQAEATDLAALAELAGQLADPAKQARVALHRSAWASRTGDYAGMVEAAQQAVDWAHRSADGEREAEGHRLWGRGLVGLGDYDAAREHLGHALELSRTYDLPSLVADTLRSLGEATYYSGDYGGARRYEEEAYALYGELGDRRGEAMSLGDLGMVGGSLEEYDSAWQCYESALAGFREAGDQGGEVAMLSNLGYTLASQGQFAAAREYYNQALAGLRQVGSRPGEAITLCNIGLADLAQDDGASAKENYERALAIALEMGEHWIEGYARTGLGQALALLGRLDEAAEHLQQAVAVRAKLGQPGLLMESRAGLARVALDRGDLSTAMALVESILAYLDAGHNLSDAETPCLTFYTCSRVLRAADDARASALLDRSYEWLSERSQRLPDADTRRLFWQEVAWHRGILRDWMTENL